MSRACCERCLRPQTHCLCPLIPQLDSRTRVLVLQHPSEVGHALNTARLATLGLTNAELRVGEVFDDLSTLLSPPGYQARLLFPADDAQLLQAYTERAEAQPLLLVVPDGTWRKARKLLYLNPLLASLPRVTLGPGAVSRYRLRKAPEPGVLVDDRSDFPGAGDARTAGFVRGAAQTVRGVDRRADPGHG